MYKDFSCQHKLKSSRQGDIVDMSEFKNDVLKLKRRGEDGNRVITVRIKEDTLAEIDRIAKEVNYSRNELINTILEHGIRTIEIE